jgi:hypothetical protein
MFLLSCVITLNLIFEPSFLNFIGKYYYIINNLYLYSYPFQFILIYLCFIIQNMKNFSFLYLFINLFVIISINLIILVFKLLILSHLLFIIIVLLNLFSILLNAFILQDYHNDFSIIIAIFLVHISCLYKYSMFIYIFKLFNIKNPFL